MVDGVVGTSLAQTRNTPMVCYCYYGGKGHGSNKCKLKNKIPRDKWYKATGKVYGKDGKDDDSIGLVSMQSDSEDEQSTKSSKSNKSKKSNRSTESAWYM